MDNKPIVVKQPEMLQALTSSEIDIQIATAKRYPRNVDNALRMIECMTTSNEKTASECFYALKKGADVIEGVSVRFAEIVAGCWGNLRVQTRIVGNDGKTITAVGACHDLESNLAVCVEVKRRITNRDGKTYSEDMQVVTGNAASSIAFRNAVLKVVPKILTEPIIDKIKDVAIGKSKDVENKRHAMIVYFERLGVSKAQLLTFLSVKEENEITAEMIFELRGIANALKEGSTTLQDTFGQNPNSESNKIAEEARRRSAESQKKVEQAQAAANVKPATKTTTTTTKTAAEKKGK